MKMEISIPKKVKKNRLNGNGNGVSVDPPNPPAGKSLVIAAPNFKVAVFKIRGTTPLVMHKFSEKAKQTMIKTQEEGSTGKRRGAKKDPKNFDRLWKDATHLSREGWAGIPAVAFFKAMVAACRMVDFKQTHARQAFYVVPDGWSRDPGDRSGLVKITKGEPSRFDAPVRLQGTTTDIRSRPLWEPGWECSVKIRFDADMFNITDVANLLMRAGNQVGILEGRPSSPSGGVGWGLFDLVK